MNMISGSGRMPAIAAPTLAPMIASSEIGVLRTRSSPCLVDRPSVTWNTPPPAESATSSPRTNTRSSAASAWSIAWLMALRNVSRSFGSASSPGSSAVVGRP